MLWRPWIIAAIMAVVLRGAEIQAPSHLYVVSVSFSDYGPGFCYRVLDVKPEGLYSTIRYSRVAPANVYCPGMIVQSAEARAPHTLAQLVKSSNPCAISRNELDAAVKRYPPRRSESVFEAVSFGLVAQCGNSEVVLPLPIPQSVDLKRLRRGNHAMAGLWGLGSNIAELAFGPKDIFHGRTHEEDLVLQRAGARVVPQLISGQYDAGLATAVQGNVGSGKAPTFHDLLENYRGPVSAEEAKTPYVLQLMNAGAYEFSRFVLPKYPVLAMQARIQGKVELRFTLEPDTGEVLSVEAVSGHPLLKPGAVDAAKEWRFRPSSITSRTLRLTLDYALRCP